ncbi:PIN domain-like protein [Microstroma glucosiphilum]|uniref:PIN domain-like protein n=1 Tax=Pseudomicrostroma glucosiphilum TaxID=1684307 RepID=A0A316U037_9BASI|nr:PIN domain-like protein [Pseudomicrostroma glucosiphilum]PWN18228.1 PIN domain-like protein [Pseudomicrostroma glucosiphilum]
MGVQGLWSLLQPAARPIRLEDLEGKRFAVDSSIWLYHFRMAMRDKEGRTLANAHILGFFWRITKLLHFGLRPVFVFDGGAPVMKRQTLIGRKARRTGAKESHALAAKKLLNAQMRQAALQHVAAGQGAGRDQRADNDGDEWQDEDTGMGSNVVYFDDYSNEAGPSRPAAAPRAPASMSRSPSKQGTLSAKSPSPVKAKKNIDYHRDPYALPHLDKDITSLTASSGRGEEGSGGPRRGRRNDFRFATDSELRHLLSSITPSDIDMSSPLFRSLPFELQYELVGDMRAASRGTSYKRLQQMLKTSPTAIDFSRAQVLNLKNRNELTQKVFEVTDEIGDANIKIPIRVAGERNREYVLVRREGDETGFVLGVRNQQGASKDKAIVVGGEPERVDISSDEEEDDVAGRGKSRLRQDDDDDDEDLDEVEVPTLGEAAGPSRPSTISRSPSNAFKASDANNPDVRRALAEQLLTKRAQEHIREKMREKGIINEDEILEEQLKLARQRMKEGGGKGEELFSPRKSGRAAKTVRTSAQDLDVDDDDAISWPDSDAPEVISDDNDDDDAAARQLEEDELQDLAYALSASTSKEPRRPAGATTSQKQPVTAVDSDEEEQDESMLDDVDVLPAVKVKDEEPLVNFDAGAYADLYGGPSIDPTHKSDEDGEDLDDLELVQSPAPAAKLSKEPLTAVDDVDPLAVPLQKSGPVLGFRRADRPGLRAGLDPKLFQRRKWYDDEAEANGDKEAISMKDSSPSKTSVPFKLSQSPAQSPTKPSSFPDFVGGMPSPTKAAQIRRQRSVGKLGDNAATGAIGSPFKPASPAAKALKASPKATPTKVAPPLAPPVVREDGQGRPEPPLEPLPKGDDLAATEILNAETGVVSSKPELSKIASRSSVPRADPELEAIDQQVDRREAESIPASPLSVAPEQAVIPAEVSESGATDQQARDAAGVIEDDLRPGGGVEQAAQPSEISQTQEVPRSAESQAGSLKAESQPPRTEQEHDDNFGVDGDDIAPRSPSAEPEPRGRRQLESDDETPIEWSPSPSPGLPALGPDGFPLPTVEEIEAMDAEYEQEAAALGADQGDIASFLSRTKGQGLLEAQAQIAREVEALRAEHVNTKKSEEEITRQMAKEIQMMLRLFGLPYITAPMEAEAQCAELVAQKLVDGIITDDSDVFLFGGTRVYKNMFNNNKVVECFLLSDLQRELGLDREKLVRLAYLLGSDYTEGLASVGPVVAMEILSLFPGEDGLLRFKEWWVKVQSGRDTPQDTKGTTMRRIKKTLANKVHLDVTWPNPAVLDAYYEPAVDSSDEAFQWGLPDLDSLRTYLAEYLGWSTTKTDQYVVPVIEAQSRRSRARGNQTTLDRNGFFDVSGGTGVYAGRTLPKYGSSRLQNVVNGFRQATHQQASKAAGGSTGSANKRSKKPAKRQRKTTGQVENVGEDGEGDDDVQMLSSPPAEAAGDDFDLLALPEEAIGKAMANRRPIVRREQMRLDDGQAQDELDANIAALEGAPKDSANASRQEKPKKTTASKKDAVPAVEASDASAAEESGESGEEFVPSGSSKKRKSAKGSTSSRGARGSGRARGSARGGGRGRGGKSRVTTPNGHEGANPDGPQQEGDGATTPTEATNSNSAATAAPVARARKPARARGARGPPRHAQLTAARNMRLDGPLPESNSAPLRPETMRRSRSSSSSTTTGAGIQSRLGTPRARGGSNGEAAGSGARERIEIELRSDDEE